MKTSSKKLFFNEGFGWVCANCEKTRSTTGNEVSRLMNEGEAESKNPKLSNQSMAIWADQNKESLVCPSCDISDKI